MGKRNLVLTQKINGKFASFTATFNKSDNLVAVLQRYANLENAMLCNSATEACEIATAWNDSYKKNGTYLFDGIID